MHFAKLFLFAFSIILFIFSVAKCVARDSVRASAPVVTSATDQSVVGTYPVVASNSAPGGGVSNDDYVTAGATYYYVVKAVAAGDVSQSTASNEASATLPSL
jgi:hypothetical protein